MITEMYHYTTVDGFHGIISNRSIRMTESNYLNDPSDCHLFISLVKEYLDNHPEIFDNNLNDLRDVSDNERQDIKEIYDRCNLIRYMDYIYDHVSLYVFSLSYIEDDMSMWNHYGRGGMRLAMSVNELTQYLVGTLNSNSNDEYLIDEDVIYVDPKQGIEGISFDNFAALRLLQSSTEGSIFEEHRSFIRKKSHYKTDQLYELPDAIGFIDIYMNSYLNTLHYLLHKTTDQNERIDKTTPEEDICRNVYRNVSRLTNYYIWKRDISPYMIVLSALIKSNTYEYEKEHRLVYFQYTGDTKAKEENYIVKHIGAGDFIQPYVTFENVDLLNSLKGVKLSPWTRNLPRFSDTTYKQTLRKYVSNCVPGSNVTIGYSDHAIRW